ncbi:MAG: DUF4956 domain-containing protein [Planctomycetes bacterium]|nr:DUF4956 domain-containing protein [Planctomycetota bacterium]
MSAHFDWMEIGQFALRLCVAFGLGLLLAANPVSLLVNRGPTRGHKTIYAVALLCVASAVVVVVIGDSLARAFGVVGLGGFIRFRSVIQDPRDAAVYFLGIGVGMACGLGQHLLAGVAVAVLMVMIAGLDRYVGRRREDLAIAELFRKEANAPTRSS